MNKEHFQMLLRRIFVSTIASALCIGFSVFSAHADDFPLGYPGNTWGNLTYDQNNISGSSLLGTVRQGVEFFKLPYDTTLYSYVSFGGRLRTLNETYYNVYSPSAGTQIRGGTWAAGYEYFYERYPALKQSVRPSEFYITSYQAWNTASILGISAVRLPGSAWGYASYNINGINGSGLMGFLRQGIGLYTFPWETRSQVYAELRYRGRTKNRIYYDAEGIALGVELQHGSINWGVDYYWERFPVLHQHSYRWQYYIGWFTNWDFKTR